MLVDLAVAPLELVHPVLHAAYDQPRRPHLASVTWSIGGRSVTAGILSASHQVVVDGLLVETVACDLGTGVTVTDGTTVAGRNHRFEASVRSVTATELAVLVDGAIDRARGDGTVIGRFPTDPRAITAVDRTPSGWETIHTYPSGDGGTVVLTRTELTR